MPHTDDRIAAHLQRLDDGELQTIIEFIGIDDIGTEALEASGGGQLHVRCDTPVLDEDEPR